MTLLGYELRKLFRLPALWVFLALCLALNFMLIFSSEYGLPFFNETSETASVLGQRVNEDFVAGLGEIPQTENGDILAGAVADMTDTFDDFDVDSLSQYYESMVAESPTAVHWMQSKYEKLSARIAELAESNASLDLYAGPMTHDSHQFLFGTLLRAISAESCILAALAVLYLFGYEKLNRTELTACVSRTGRRLWRTKTAAGILAALAMLLLLAAVSLGVYFSLWDYSGVWSANVSSGFNYIEDVLMVKPFITWGNLSVAGYLSAALALIAAMTVISSLVSAITGTLIQNTYVAALALLLICAGGFTLLSAFADLKLWAAYEISAFLPVTLWTTQSIWFTESGVSSILPWQETITAALGLLLFSCFTGLALRRFYRKDIA